MADKDYNALKIKRLSRWGIGALPLGLLLGFIVGILLGNAVIGVAIGAALGFGGAAALLAAVVVFRSTDLTKSR